MRAGKKQGTGPPNAEPSVNPGSTNGPRGDDANVFKVKEGFRTLRAIAKKVYGNVNDWTKLFNKNEKKLKDKGITRSEAATHQLPLGMSISF
jgi:nucleoid-associated protein YgaU